MPIDRKLLEILVCPVTKQSVSILSASRLAVLNEKILAGDVVNQGGDKVSEALSSALVIQNGTVIYPVAEEIPIMLEDQSIAAIQLDD